MSMNYYFLKIPKWVAPKLNSLQYLRINIVEVTEQTSTYLVVRIDGPRGGGELGLFQISKQGKAILIYAILVRLNSPTG